MARQRFDCVRNCIPAGTGDVAVGPGSKRKVVKVVAGGSYDYGEPAVALVSAITDIPLGVVYDYDEGSKKAGVCTKGLIVVEKSVNALTTDVGKQVTASATVKGTVDIATIGGFGVVIAIESTSSKNLLVEISCPALDTQKA